VMNVLLDPADRSDGMVRLAHRLAKRLSTDRPWPVSIEWRAHSRRSNLNTDRLNLARFGREAMGVDVPSKSRKRIRRSSRSPQVWLEAKP